MRHTLIAVIILSLTSCFRTAGAEVSDTFRVSLLTISAGADVYERFGHTAIRVRNATSEGDVVFHYGVFDFDAPHFVYRFVKGETDYQLGLADTDRFLRAQGHRGLTVTEQELDLTPAQAEAVVRALCANYDDPQARYYRYNYFFDNCATRPYRLIDRATAGAICYDSTALRRVTLRDMVQEKTGRTGWLDFGISLVVAGRADRVTTFDEQMFLPDYLAAAYARATLADSARATPRRPLVCSTATLVAGDPAVAAVVAAPPSWCSPTLCAWALLALCVGLGVVQWRTGRTFRAVDTALLLAAGGAGTLVWFLNFLSEHPAVDHNWNCLWLWPTHLIAALLIWIKKYKKGTHIYFLLNFAALMAYLISCGFTAQHVHPAFPPLVLTLATRAVWLAGLLPSGAKEKPHPRRDRRHIIQKT